MVITKKIILLLALLISVGEFDTRFSMCRLKRVLNIIKSYLC